MKLSLLGILCCVCSWLWAASHQPLIEVQQIVKHYCMTCHAAHPLIAVGAPRAGDAADWTPRLKQGQDVLWKHVIAGYNAMPARGGCFECRDDQLKEAIAVLIARSP